MFNQHAKWLKVTRDIPWRRPIASLNYLLTSHVWRQDHNGFSHQDPGFIDHVVNKKAEIIRVYLPPDANTLLSVADHCLRSKRLRQRDRRGQAACARLPDDGRGDPALHARDRDLGLGEQRRRRGARRRAGVRRRRADARDARGRAADSPAPARPEGARRQRCRPDAPAARERASARARRRRVRRALHDEPTGDLRLPRLPVAHPSPHLPPHEPREPARAGLQGGGDDDDAVRHGDAERHGPLPPRDRRDRPRPRARAARRARQAARWSRSGCATARTRARSATTRRSARLEQAGRAGRDAETRCSSSQRRLDRAQAPSRRGRESHAPSTTSSRPTPSATASSTEASASSSRSSSPTRWWTRSTALDDRAAAQHAGPRGAARGATATPRRATRRGLRHRVPSTIPPRASTYAVPSGGATEWGVKRYGFHGLVGRVGRRPGAGAARWSSATSAAAARSPPCSTGARSTRRWASARSRACRWRLVPARSIPARSSTCCASAGLARRARPRPEPRVRPARARGLDRPARPASGLELYAYRIATAVGAMAVALGGLDALAFTRRRGGGIGRRSRAVCRRSSPTSASSRSWSFRRARSS